MTGVMAAPVAGDVPPARPIEEWIKTEAYALGFDLAGIAALGPAETADQYERWLAAGYHGDMHYLARDPSKRRDSSKPVPGARSAIVVALNYGGITPAGSVARYARGDDYHAVMLSKLEELQRRIAERVGKPVRGKPYVDTGPLLERDLARRAGLGWFGKNSNLINPRIGSFFFIGTLLLDLGLRADEAFGVDRCGTCTRCLDACPTDAFAEPGVLDSTKCISYLTIELRDAIPLDLRKKVGDHAYGCDICQEVCPWNVSFARELTEPALAPRANNTNPDLRSWLVMTEEDFRDRFRGSPMKRARRTGLARNAAVVLGNTGGTEDLAVIERALAAEQDPMVRDHLTWARTRIAERVGA